MNTTNLKERNAGILAVWTDWNSPGLKGRYGGVGWYRIINPLKKIGCNVVSGEHVDIGGKNRLENAFKMKQMGDIWFFKYVDDITPVTHLLTARDVMKTRLVIDIDDDLFSVHPHNYAYQWHYPGSPKNEALKYLISSANAVTVSTEPLANSMRRLNNNVTVLPNAIDPEIWKVPIKRNTTDKIRIGWILSANHEQDTEIIVPVMQKILKKYPNVEFWAIGFDSPEFEKLPRYKFVLGTKGYKPYPKFLAGLGLDISVAPLVDDDFNRCKSNIKWMEAAMVEVPTVASRVYPYEYSIRDGETGFLAGNEKQWINSLSKLIESKELREKMAKQAKEQVLREYTVDNVLDKYNEFFAKI